MSFAEVHNRITKRVTKTEPIHYWVRSLLFSYVLLFIVMAYQVAKGASLDFYQLNIGFSLLGMYMVGISYVLSGLTYFFDFVDTKVVYRKYLGLVGFYYLLIHSVFSFINYFFIDGAPSPNFDFGYEWAVFGLYLPNTIAFIAGLVAILGFAYMAMISNKYSMIEIGGIAWRKQLRYIGYLAYLIVVVHFGLKRFTAWENWLKNFNGLPPQSLILIIFVVFVFIMRIFLFLALLKKGERKS